MATIQSKLPLPNSSTGVRCSTSPTRTPSQRAAAPSAIRRFRSITEISHSWERHVKANSWPSPSAHTPGLRTEVTPGPVKGPKVLQSQNSRPKRGDTRRATVRYSIAGIVATWLAILPMVSVNRGTSVPPPLSCSSAEVITGRSDVGHPVFQVRIQTQSPDQP